MTHGVFAQTADNDLALIYAEIPVQITTPLQDQEVMEKQEATFVCEVSKPNQTAKWLCNGVEVNIASGRYEVKVDGTRHSLTIKNAEKSDQAQYTVAFADVSSTASLSVTGKLNFSQFHANKYRVDQKVDRCKTFVSRVYDERERQSVVKMLLLLMYCIVFVY